MIDLANLFDVRWLLVFSPITTAIAWAMFVSGEPNLRDPWQF